jgi:hypothetical protein
MYRVMSYPQLTLLRRMPLSGIIQPAICRAVIGDLPRRKARVAAHSPAAFMPIGDQSRRPSRIRSKRCAIADMRKRPGLEYVHIPIRPSNTSAIVAGFLRSGCYSAVLCSGQPFCADVPSRHDQAPGSLTHFLPNSLHDAGPDAELAADFENADARSSYCKSCSLAVNFKGTSTSSEILFGMTNTQDRSRSRGLQSARRAPMPSRR